MFESHRVFLVVKRKDIDAPTEHSHLDGRVPSNHASPASLTSPRDMMVVQEDEGTSSKEEGLWDQDLDIPSFLEKVLLSNKAKEKLMSLKKSFSNQDSCDKRW